MFVLRRFSNSCLAARTHTAWLYKQAISKPFYSTEVGAAATTTATPTPTAPKVEQTGPLPIKPTILSTQYNGTVVKVKNTTGLSEDNVDAVEKILLDELFLKEEKTGQSYEERLEKYCDYLSSKYTVMYKLKEYGNLIEHFLNDVAVYTESIFTNVLKSFIKVEEFGEGIKLFEQLKEANAIPSTWSRVHSVALQLYARQSNWDKSLEIFSSLLQNQQLSSPIAKFLVQKLNAANEKEKATRVVSALVEKNFAMKSDLAQVCKEAVAENTTLAARITSQK